MNRPNVFNYAKKELSQDAIVCWLLACLDSELPQYREIGLQFIRFLFDKDTIDAKDVRLADGPYSQYFRMDVYAVVSVRDRLYPIIVEDKINTYLHDDQMKKCCEKVAQWMLPKAKDTYLGNLKKKLGGLPTDWGEICYVYYKTGHPSGWQKKDFLKEVEKTKSAVQNINKKVDLLPKEIYLEDMISFLSKIRRDTDVLLEDYYETLKDAADRRKFVRDNLFTNTEGCEKALSDENGCNEMASVLLMERIFGESCKINYSHQEWASYDLRDIVDQAGNKIRYGFHFKNRKFENKNRYAFMLKQSIAKAISTSAEEVQKNKTEQVAQIQEICQGIVDTLAAKYPQVIVRSKDPDLSKKVPTLMLIFISDESGPIDVCNYVKDFSKLFVSKIEEEFGERVQKCQDNGA